MVKAEEEEEEILFSASDEYEKHQPQSPETNTRNSLLEATARAQKRATEYLRRFHTIEKELQATHEQNRSLRRDIQELKDAYLRVVTEKALVQTRYEQSLADSRVCRQQLAQQQMKLDQYKDQITRYAQLEQELDQTKQSQLESETQHAQQLQHVDELQQVVVEKAEIWRNKALMAQEDQESTRYSNERLRAIIDRQQHEVQCAEQTAKESQAQIQQNKSSLDQIVEENPVHQELVSRIEELVEERERNRTKLEFLEENGYLVAMELEATRLQLRHFYDENSAQSHAEVEKILPQLINAVRNETQENVNFFLQQTIAENLQLKRQVDYYRKQFK